MYRFNLHRLLLTALPSLQAASILCDGSMASTRLGSCDSRDLDRGLTSRALGEIKLPRTHLGFPGRPGKFSPVNPGKSFACWEKESIASLSSKELHALCPPTSTPVTIPDGFPRMDVENNGSATFYDGNTLGGNCGFTDYVLPIGLDGVAIGSTAWSNSLACGSCIAASWSGISVKVMVTDRCPECAYSLDLYETAFAKLARLDVGVLANVSWSVVDCGLTTPVQYKWKEGSSRWWVAIQTRNTNEPVLKLELSLDNTTFVELTKHSDSGYFIRETPFDSKGPFTVRTTSLSGKVLIDTGLMLVAGESHDGTLNF